MNTKTIATIIIQLIVGAAVGAISGLISDKFLKQKYSNENQKLEDLGIKDFEITQKLFADGYYSQSILEAFKCLEIHLKRLVLEKGIYLRTSLIQDVIQIAKKNDLLSEKDIAIINNIRNMRNSAAHLDIDYTKQQADEAIIFIKELIKRNTNAKGKTT
jgi:HEPN domain-containing protein